MDSGCSMNRRVGVSTDRADINLEVVGLRRSLCDRPATPLTLFKEKLTLPEDVARCLYEAAVNGPAGLAKLRAEALLKYIKLAEEYSKEEAELQPASTRASARSSRTSVCFFLSKSSRIASSTTWQSLSSSSMAGR